MPRRLFLVLSVLACACRRDAAPPPADAGVIPAGPYGDAVRRGRALLVAALDPAGRDMADIVAYLAFLSHGMPVGPAPAGARLQQWASFTADTAAGARLFATTCVQCHGPEGEGTVGAPPLWGPASYNIGAGMARVRTAAEFIRRNMPFDHPGTLTDQQAFDVAAYVNAQPRPDYRGKEDDWPNGDPPPDVAYPTRAQQKKPLPR